MKLGITLIIAIISAFFIIIFADPYVREYKEKEKYNFTLNTADGEIELSDYRGKAVAVYFGYMYCADVCPTSLGMLSESMKSLSKEELEQFQGIFVSVDPARDNVKDIKDYAKYFHPNFIGGTNDEDTIAQISQTYGGYYKQEKKDEKDMDYTVSHTSYIFIFDKKGKLSVKLGHFLTPEEIAEAIKQAM